MKFIYKDNKKIPAIILAEIEANSILEADRKFEEKFKINPAKIPSIGCIISK